MSLIQMMHVMVSDVAMPSTFGPSRIPGPPALEAFARLAITGAPAPVRIMVTLQLAPPRPTRRPLPWVCPPPAGRPALPELPGSGVGVRAGQILSVAGALPGRSGL